MSLGLHLKCKERLVEVLNEQLLKILVFRRMFLDRTSVIDLYKADEVIPIKGEIRKNIEGFISESPVFDFVYETLAQELTENQKYDSAVGSLKLTELEGFEDPKQTAKRLVEELESLPWKYTFTFNFHKELSEKLLPVIEVNNLGNNIRIAQIDVAFEERYPLVSGIKARDQSIAGGGIASLLARPIENKWEQGTLCMQFEQDGFIGYYGDTETSEIVRDDFKSFCGLGIALRLFKVDTKYRSTPAKAMYFIHRNIGEDWIVQRSLELDTSTSDTFHDLTLHDLNGKLSNEQLLGDWINGALSDIDKIYANRDLTKKLLLACQWLFDSYSGKNELLSFIQATIVIEILLGDKASSDQMGLGVLLRNRCAYLIGSTQSERNEILQDFQYIYDVRSKIVHGGKSRINFEERRLFRKLQWMCRRVIAEEVKLLKEDLNTNA